MLPDAVPCNHLHFAHFRVSRFFFKEISKRQLPAQDINMTDNPLGALGMRSLLRLLSRKENALKHFESDGCHLAVQLSAFCGGLHEAPLYSEAQGVIFIQ